MNERIEELAQQCMQYKLYRNALISEFDHKKFAKLLVQECSGIVQPYMSRREEDCDLVIKIKEHFGVEE